MNLKTAVEIIQNEQRERIRKKKRKASVNFGSSSAHVSAVSKLGEREGVAQKKIL